jgi:hypothetical protein
LVSAVYAPAANISRPFSADEIFGRLCSQKFFEYVKARGIDTGRVKPLEQAYGRAVYLGVETIE